jgi:NADH dehydrogenase/NADH:ubiquinone oxidoreductase subunit G
MIELIIDGQTILAETEKTILEVARQVGIDIPTLCHHDAVTPSGACRLCNVEIYPRGSTQSFLVTACNFPVEEGMEVWTNSERVLETRRMTMELLLAREPESKTIRDLAAGLGIGSTPFRLEAENTCVLCNLCVRVCREVIKADALTLITRGEKAVPHIEVSPTKCIGCGACFLLCPSHFIRMEEAEGRRVIWDTAFPMKKCSHCDAYITTEAHWKALVEESGSSLEERGTKELCPLCRRDALSSELLGLSEKPTTSLFTQTDEMV